MQTIPAAQFALYIFRKELAQDLHFVIFELLIM